MTSHGTSRHSKDAHLLGVKTGNYMPSQQYFNDDYEKILPEDEYGHEAAPNARIWRAYEQEATAYDSAMIGQARDGLDVMLVFAGLFSAVVTSFLVQASQNLQPKFTQMTALLLHDLVVMQIQAPEGAVASAANITLPSADPSFTFTPTSLDVWINGLWMVSLAGSLTVALSAVLVKQWLHRYLTLPSGTPGMRSHIRHFRFVGFEEWHVEAIIGTLPIVMQFSLALFFAGLVLFFVPLRLSLACTMGVISMATLLLYIASNVMPLLDPQCPYQTPLTDFLPHVTPALHAVLRKASRRVLRISRRLSFASLLGHQSITKSFRERESQMVEASYDRISVDAMDWAFHMTGNPTLRSIVLHAIAGLPHEISGYARAQWQGDLELQSMRFEMLRAASVRRPSAVRSMWYRCQPGQEACVERLCRSVMFYAPDREHTALFHHDEAPPRLMAACWLSNSGFYSFRTQEAAVEDLIRILQSTESTTLFLSVWKELVSRILEALHPEDPFVLDSALSAHLLKFLLPGSIMDSKNRAVEPVTMTLMDAVSCTSLRHDILAGLDESRLLTPFINQNEAVFLRFSRRYTDKLVESRTIAGVGRFAIHHIAHLSRDGVTSNRESQYYALFLYVLERTFDSIHPGDSALTIPEWLLEVFADDCSVIDQVSACLDPSDAKWDCFSVLLRIYQALARSSGLNSFAFPSLRRVVVGGMRRFSRNDTHVVSSLEARRAKDATMDLLECALLRGHLEAFQIFLDLEWSKVLCEMATIDDSWSPKGTTKWLLESFIDGLDLLPLEKRAESLHALRQPHNIRVTILSFLLWHKSPLSPRAIDALFTPSDSTSSTESMSLKQWLELWLEERITGEGVGIRGGVDYLTIRDLFGQPTLRASDRSSSTSLDDAIRIAFRRNVEQTKMDVDEVLSILERQSAIEPMLSEG